MPFQPEAERRGPVDQLSVNAIYSAMFAREKSPDLADGRRSYDALH